MRSERKLSSPLFSIVQWTVSRSAHPHLIKGKGSSSNFNRAFQNRKKLPKKPRNSPSSSPHHKIIIYRSCHRFLPVQHQVKLLTHTKLLGFLVRPSPSRQQRRCNHGPLPAAFLLDLWPPGCPMLVCNAPSRLWVPSSSWAGPRRICSRVPVVPTLMRVPRGRTGLGVAMPQWYPRPGASCSPCKG